MSTIKSGITELSQQASPKQIRRAYLAEDYDGIGQFVNVSLSLGSSSSAIARVALTSNYRMPLEAGAELTVTVHRGSIEVIGLGS